MPELDSLAGETGGDYDVGPDPALVPDAAPATPAETSATPAPGAYEVIDPVLEGTSSATSATPAEVVKPAEAQVAPAAPALSQQQMQRAAAMGLTPEIIAAYPNPEVAILTAENIAMRSQQATYQQMQQAQVRPTPAPAPPPAPGPAPVAPNLDGMRQQLEAAGFEKSLIEAHVSLAQSQHKNELATHALAVEQHKSALQNLELQNWARQMHGWGQQTQQQIAAQQAAHASELINRDFEAFVSKQPDEVKQLLADPATRHLVMQEADFRVAGMMARGVQPPDNQKLFEAASSIALAGKTQALAREEVRREVAQHQGRATAKPRGSDMAKPGGINAAIAHVNSIYQRKGIPAQGATYSVQDI